MPHEGRIGPPRELAVDLYRVTAVALVVIGHWLAASVAFRHGEFVRENPLVDMPWTQWLTWIFQVVPVFFVVAGYAGAASWTRHKSPYGEWLQSRFRGVLGPTAAYVLIVLAAVGIAVAARVDSSALETSGWAVAMHLWFIPVYLVVVALTPVAVSLHRRWSGLAIVFLCAVVAAIDAASVSGWCPAAGWLNNVFCWLALFQVGTAWFFGALSGVRALGLAIVGGGVATAAILFGPYPVSLIGVPGEVIQNSAPPSIVMLAVGLTQAGVLIAIAPTVTRALRASALQRPLAAVNQRSMLVYLWHMIAVVVVAVTVYPTGLFPQPPPGTGGWWQSRLLWVAVLTAVTVVVLTLVGWGRSLLAGDLVAIPVRLRGVVSAPVHLVGAGIAAAALWQFSLLGFAPSGRFPIGLSVVLVSGLFMVALAPTPTGDRFRKAGVLGPYLPDPAPHRLMR